MVVAVRRSAARRDFGAFCRTQRDKPQLWNGRILLGRHPVFAGGRLSASYFETDFASFLAWRDWGFPDKDVFNGLGWARCAAPTAPSCSARWASHTSTAGRIYFPSGTPDLDDVRDGAVDISGSVVRELEEETGLAPDEYRSEPALALRLHRPVMAMIRLLHVDMSGEALRSRIEANLAWQQSPELSAIHLVRGTRDLTAAMPRFVTAFLEAQLAT